MPPETVTLEFTVAEADLILDAIELLVRRIARRDPPGAREPLAEGVEGTDDRAAVLLQLVGKAA
jgi:hypothetical protein